MSSDTYSSLPSRPLTVAEADSLADDGDFFPLSMLSELPEWLGGDTWDPTDFSGASTAAVITLFHGTDDYCTAIGFSEPDGGWVKIGRWEADEYDPEAVEEAVQEWGEETYPEWNHGSLDIDEL